MPLVWRSKTPIYYPLAAVATLSRAGAVEAFPVVAACSLALAAAGFYAARPPRARRASGRPPCRDGASSVSSASWSTPAIHPYFNQLWGLVALGPMLLFGLRLIEAPNRRDAVLLALFAALGLAAYPLMILFPAVILAGAAVVERRAGRLCLPARPRMPRGWPARLALAAAALVAIPAAAVVAAGILEKAASAADLLLGASRWPSGAGDLDFYSRPASSSACRARSATCSRRRCSWPRCWAFGACPVPPAQDSPR